MRKSTFCSVSRLGQIKREGYVERFFLLDGETSLKRNIWNSRSNRRNNQLLCKTFAGLQVSILYVNFVLDACFGCQFCLRYRWIWAYAMRPNYASIRFRKPRTIKQIKGQTVQIVLTFRCIALNVDNWTLNTAIGSATLLRVSVTPCRLRRGTKEDSGQGSTLTTHLIKNRFVSCAAGYVNDDKSISVWIRAWVAEKYRVMWDHIVPGCPFLTAFFEPINWLFRPIRLDACSAVPTFVVIWCIGHV